MSEEQQNPSVPGSGEPTPDLRPPARTPGVDEDAPDGVHKAAAGADVTDAEEYDALDWYLGATQRPSVTVPVQLWTPRGDKTLTWHLRAVDGSRIQQIDDEHRNGVGPFAKLDKVGFAAQLVAESAIEVWGEKGNKVRIDSDRFRGGAPGGVTGAVLLRFKNQEGLLEGLGDRVQELAGYSGDRVGAAQRVLVDAAGNSSSGADGRGSSTASG